MDSCWFLLSVISDHINQSIFPTAIGSVDYPAHHQHHHTDFTPTSIDLNDTSLAQHLLPGDHYKQLKKGELFSFLTSLTVV